MNKCARKNHLDFGRLVTSLGPHKQSAEAEELRHP